MSELNDEEFTPKDAVLVTDSRGHPAFPPHDKDETLVVSPQPLPVGATIVLRDRDGEEVLRGTVASCGEEVSLTASDGRAMTGHVLVVSARP
jgi:hypothetical protein